jgi:hypothetical protein
MSTTNLTQKSPDSKSIPSNQAEANLSPTEQVIVRLLCEANLWPKPGEKSPPAGYTPAHMRRTIQKISKELNGEMLLAAYYFLMVLSCIDYEETKKLPWFKSPQEGKR